MAKGERWVTVAQGIRCREVEGRLFRGKPDRYWTLRFKLGGKEHHERLGWSSEGWNLSKAQTELARLRAAAVTGDGAVTLRQRREEAQAAREAEERKLTMQKLWELFSEAHTGKPSHGHDVANWKRHLAERFGNWKPETIRTAHIDALRAHLEGLGFAAQTVKHTLGLVRRILRWGAMRGMCELPPLNKLHFEMPRVDNIKTETLDAEQIENLLAALDRYPDQRLASTMRLALATGMRRSAIFSLQWSDLDFRNRQIMLRGEVAKSGRTGFIPMNPVAYEILQGIKPTGSDLVFSEKNSMSTAVKRLSEYVKPFLPAGFRPYHGLRHTYASTLASSGTVDLMTLQKLLTHESASMVQRYAHLATDTLHRASNVMSQVMQAAANDETTPQPIRAEESPGRREKAKVRAFRPISAYEKGKR